MHKLPYPSSSILIHDRAADTLGTIDNDDTTIQSTLELLNQILAIIGRVANTICLQDHTLHWWLQECMHL